MVEQHGQRNASYHPLKRLANWYRRQGAYFKALVAVGAFAVAALLAFASTIFPMMVGKIGFGLMYVVVALCIILAQWEIVKPRFWRAITVSLTAVLFVIGGFVCKQFAIQGSPNVTQVDRPRFPLVAIFDRSFYVKSAAADSRDQLIVKVPIKNVTGREMAFAAYGISVTRPIAKSDAEEANVFRSLKREVERRAKIGGAGLTTISEDNAGNPGISLPGPYLQGNEWDEIERGLKYVYWYVLFVPSDNSKDFGICGLFDAHQRLACLLGTD